MYVCMCMNALLAFIYLCPHAHCGLGTARNELGIAKIPTEVSGQENFTLDQEGELRRVIAQRQEVHLVFILTQVVAVSFLHWLGSDLTGIFIG